MASETATDNHLLKAATITSNLKDAADGDDGLVENGGEEEEDDTKPAETPKFRIFISEDVVSGCWYYTVTDFL
jgi:hypothetical protein